MKFFKRKKHISLVLGGGGARGLTHIGVIHELLRKGYIIDEVVGCSIGALVGASYAQGSLDKLEEWMLGMTKRNMFRLLDFTNPIHGLLKGQKIFDALSDILPDEQIEDLPIRFSAVASDMLHEKEVLFTKGSLYQAIRASIAIPAVFTSVAGDDWNLVDGGVLNPLPINYVYNKDRNTVLAVNLDARPDPEVGQTIELKKASALSILQESYNMTRRRLIDLSIELYQPDYVIHVPENISGIWDYDDAKRLIDAGTKLCREVIPDLS